VAALTSAFVADRPAVPSVVGFTIVGLAVLALAGGVIAYRLRTRGAATAAVGLCLIAALVGWLFRPDLDILDTEQQSRSGSGSALRSGCRA
jgi:hypothetical protein